MTSTSDADELYAPPTPPQAPHDDSSDSIPEYKYPLDDYLHSNDEDGISPTTLPSIPTPPDPRVIYSIFQHGTVDFRAWQKSRVPIPPEYPGRYVSTALLGAQISAARMRIANLLLKTLPQNAQPSSSSRTEPASPCHTDAEKEKEESLETMLHHARFVIDTAGILRHPSLQSRGYYYLALAAQEEENEALAESYFEKALEARGSWEGAMAAKKLGVDESDCEGHRRGREARRRSVFGEGSGEGEGREDIVVEVPAVSLEAELMGSRDPFDDEDEEPEGKDGNPEVECAGEERSVEEPVA